MRNLQVQKLKNLKLNDDIQYKMKSIINEMVIDVMDIDLNDNKSMLNLFYNNYNNISNDFIQACRDKYFNSIMVQDELKKYINSYRSNVLKLEVPRGIVDRINSPTDKINFMILVSIDIFIHLNQKVILDSFRSLYSNVNLK